MTEGIGALASILVSHTSSHMLGCTTSNLNKQKGLLL